MNKSGVQGLLALVIVMSMLITGTWPAVALASQTGDAEPIYLRLKQGTFDPLQSQPAIPESAQITAYPGNERGLYIVQFEGPVEEGWQDEVRAAGGRLVEYLPDYAFLVWMNEDMRSRVETLAPVRWVGVYQPAYKISPSYDGAPVVRVSLVPDADLAAVERQLAGLGFAETRVTGDQFNLFVADGDVTGLAAMAQVLWIEEYRIPEAYNDVGTGIMGGTTAWVAGFDGSGMKITVADTGVDTGVDSSSAGDMHPDLDNRFTNLVSWPMTNDPAFIGCIANLGNDDGASDRDSGHGTHVIGSVAGNGTASGGQIRGLAHHADLTFQAVEQYVDFTPTCESYPYYYTDGYYLLGIPDNYGDLFQQAYNWGSRIHTNSWGSDVDGEYTVGASQVDQFIWTHPQMTILYSAGNEGIDANADGYVDEDSLGSPATGKNNITIGASDNERATGGYNPGGACSTWYGCWGSDYPTNPTRDDPLSDTRQELAAFSSRGPTDDGRIKPDMVAPGTNILSTRSRLAASDGWGPYVNSNYTYMGGTSMATPLAAGAAALVREYYVESKGHTPSAALIKATLINSAVDIGGYGNPAEEAGMPIPNNHEGWGMINVGAATRGQRQFHDGDTVATSGEMTYNFQIGFAVPFKVSLVWSDYPGSTVAAKALVNNLDLIVEGPGGVTYRGNQFSGGWSVTGGTADTTNNVENVYVRRPAVGTWTVRVRGANVPQGPQPFALVATGFFGAPAVPDHHVYLPIVTRQHAPEGGTTGPNPGFWQEANTYVEFYVTTDRSAVYNFAILVSVDGCGTYKITNTTALPIVENAFSFTGPYYANGTFSSDTTCSGQTGLNNYYIPGCGYVTGGPWAWTAAWQSSLRSSETGAGGISVEKVNDPAGRPVYQATRNAE